MGSGDVLELKLLMVAATLGLAQIAAAVVIGMGSGQPLAWQLGARDEARPLGVLGARVARAARNFQETFPLFAAAVLVCVAAGKAGGSLSVDGAWLYVASRVAYAPIYAMGLPLVRTLVWTASVVGIAMVLMAAFA